MFDLLRFGMHRGSPFAGVNAALGGVGRYWRMRRASPLTLVSERELTERGNENGFTVERLPHNLTHFRSRWTAVLRVNSAA